MKSLSKRTSKIASLVSAVLAVGALTVIAKTSPTFDIHTSVITKAAESEKEINNLNIGLFTMEFLFKKIALQNRANSTDLIVI